MDAEFGPKAERPCPPDLGAKSLSVGPCGRDAIDRSWKSSKPRLADDLKPDRVKFAREFGHAGVDAEVEIAEGKLRNGRIFTDVSESYVAFDKSGLSPRPRSPESAATRSSAAGSALGTISMVTPLGATIAVSAANPGSVGAVDADDHGAPSLPLGDMGSRRVPVFRRDRVLKGNDDPVGARAGSLVEALWPAGRDEQEGTGANSGASL